MKIISKHRDYFDYLVGYYGYDEHIVWDRRNDKPLNFKWTDRLLFFICGTTIPVIKRGQYFIFNPHDEKLTNSWRDNFEKEWMIKWCNQPTKVNTELRQPILCVTKFQGEKDYFIPCLADFGFASQIEAHEMYEKIYAFMGWLKDNPEIPNNQSDNEKIVAHGFDTRTSFRPTIKS